MRVLYRVHFISWFTVSCSFSFSHSSSYLLYTAGLCQRFKKGKYPKYLTLQFIWSSFSGCLKVWLNTLMHSSIWSLCPLSLVSMFPLLLPGGGSNSLPSPGLTSSSTPLPAMWRDMMKTLGCSEGKEAFKKQLDSVLGLRLDYQLSAVQLVNNL